MRAFAHARAIQASNEAAPLRIACQATAACMLNGRSLGMQGLPWA